MISSLFPFPERPDNHPSTPSPSVAEVATPPPLSTQERQRLEFFRQRIRPDATSHRPPAQLTRDRDFVEPAAGRAAATYPDGLTVREVSVLRLLAGGQRNREIAAALVVAESTVERHLVNIYREIGARCRAEAAAYALCHGLAPASGG